MQLKNLLPFIIILCGLYLGSKGAFFFIKRPIRTLKFTFKGDNTKEALKSLALALSGTLGVGNIVGVMIGLRFGGVGSVFWLAISSVFASAIKYCEVKFSASHTGGLGMISTVKEAFRKIGVPLSKIYSALALLLSLFMGSALQARAIFDSSESALPISSPLLASVLVTALFILLKSGKRAIRDASSVIIPIAAFLYTGTCLLIIFSNFSAIPGVIVEILGSALLPKSIGGGLFAALGASGIFEGFSRGLLSNEAGAGTSSFSHTAHGGTSPEIAGCFGILEVICDTSLLCPLTALTVLTGTKARDFSGGLSLLSDIFRTHLGQAGPVILFLSVLAFAFSTVICWFYYGSVCREYIFGKRGSGIYLAVYLLSFVFSYRIDYAFLVYITDLSLFMLTLISLSAIIKNAKVKEIAPDFRI
jgi:AGCS family alanine or glycine:cation symporter